MSASTSDPSVSLERRSRTSRLSPSFGTSNSGDDSQEDRVQIRYRASSRPSSSRHVVSYASILTSEAPVELHSPPTSPLLVKRRIRSSSILSGGSMDSLQSPGSAATSRSITAAASAAAAAAGASPVLASSSPPLPLTVARLGNDNLHISSGCESSSRGTTHDTTHHLPHAKSLDAQRINDTMVYLEGPQIYTCSECRTHLSSHDDIISKSFHGRNGRAYLLDQCVNVTVGPSEDRRLMTGLHTVCDIFCKRCNTLVGWTYKRAYESSQKYKEGKFIVEKIHLTLDSRESRHCGGDRFRKRSLSWGSSTIASTSDSTSSASSSSADNNNMVYEY